MHIRIQCMHSCMALRIVFWVAKCWKSTPVGLALRGHNDDTNASMILSLRLSTRNTVGGRQWNFAVPHLRVWYPIWAKRYPVWCHRVPRPPTIYGYHMIACQIFVCNFPVYPSSFCCHLHTTCIFCPPGDWGAFYPGINLKINKRNNVVLWLVVDYSCSLFGGVSGGVWGLINP